MDDILAQDDLGMVLPKAIRAEVFGATDKARLANAAAGVVPVRSANVAEILRNFPGILSRKFGLQDLKLVATASQQGLPIITTNAKLKAQIMSHADRNRLCGNVKILVPGVDFQNAADLKKLLGA